jgi:hypothetical protein
MSEERPQHGRCRYWSFKEVKTRGGVCVRVRACVCVHARARACYSGLQLIR